MRLFRAFLAHEVKTQLRSGRFRLLAAVYTIVCLVPLVVPIVLWNRGSNAIGPSLFANMLAMIQPLATAILAAILAIDAISREQQENSFRVVSLAPISNSGYALRRWLSVVAIVVPLTFVASALAAALSYTFAGGVHDSIPWTWLLHILPIAIIYSAFAFALGTITARTILAAIIGAALLTFGLGIANDLLARSHRQLGAVFGGIMPDRGNVEMFGWSLRGWGAPPLPTEARYDVAHALDEIVPRDALIAGLAALLLGLAPLMLRRTRRDIRPWPVAPEHSLRTFIKAINRVRDDFTPDGRVEWSEIMTAMCGVLLLGGAIAALMVRETKYQRLAAERFNIETAGTPTPTPLAVVATSMRVDGTIDDDGSVRTRSVLVLRNDGATPVRTLGFSINPMLTIRSSASAGRATATRTWDRIAVVLDPPLASHAARTLTFDVTGTPGEIDFTIYNPFIQRYPRFRDAKDAIDMEPLALSTFTASANRSQLSMPLSDLAPVLRYTKWEPINNADGSVSIREEQLATAIPLHLDLRVPRDVFVADSCGSISSASRLLTACEADPAKHLLFGGALRSIPIGPTASLAFLPTHQPFAKLHGGTLQQALALIAKAWPGLGLRDRIIFVERPSRELERYYGDYNPSYTIESIQASGALQLLPELMLTTRKPIKPGIIATSILAHALFERRLLVRNQHGFFARFYSYVARARVGESLKSGAVEPGIQGGTPAINPVLLDPDIRLRRVLVDIENRVGSDRLVAGINDFITSSREPGNAKELIDAIARRGEVSLDRVYQDYFEGRALPRLTFVDVEFHRVGDVWQITGKLRNAGSGEAFCPIVLRTAFESVRRVIRIDTNEIVPFSISTPYAPRSLQLDPDKVCYRFAAVGMIDNVDYKGER
ncbi:MAG: family peptidase [Acidobacteria bacterium]|nr:family peptidase [Acidobacteriota bacterium]